jgi:hypothetical protein
MNRLNGVNIEIQIAFQSHHLPLLIPFLEKAGIGSKEINDMIEAYIASGEKLVYERWILEYGQNVWNPIMNEKLGRSIDHQHSIIYWLMR